MARIKNTMQLIETSIGKINAMYDMNARDVDAIYQASSSNIDMICNGFKFGYMQGMKAAKAEMRKGGAVNG